MWKRAAPSLDGNPREIFLMPFVMFSSILVALSFDWV